MSAKSGGIFLAALVALQLTSLILSKMKFAHPSFKNPPCVQRIAGLLCCTASVAAAITIVLLIIPPAHACRDY